MHINEEIKLHKWAQDMADEEGEKIVSEEAAGAVCLIF